MSQAYDLLHRSPLMCRERKVPLSGSSVVICIFLGMSSAKAFYLKLKFVQVQVRRHYFFSVFVYLFVLFGLGIEFYIRSASTLQLYTPLDSLCS